MNGAGIVVNQAATEADEARKKQYRQDWEESGGGQLCLAFYDAFKKYKYYVETHSGEMARPSGPINNKYDEHTVFQECLRTVESYKREREETLRRNLEKAQSAARCEHEFLTGERCRAPKVTDSIQAGIRKLQAAIIDGKLDSKQIGHLLYTIQLAAWNVTRTRTVLAEAR
jgi:hypothetical protein